MRNPMTVSTRKSLKLNKANSPPPPPLLPFKPLVPYPLPPFKKVVYVKLQTLYGILVESELVSVIFGNMFNVETMGSMLVGIMLKKWLLVPLLA